MSLREKRRAIRLLLDSSAAEDAMATYYAYHHDANRTEIITSPADAGPGEAQGYIAISQTGIDLFRPLLTMRLPINDLELSADILARALPINAGAFIACPAAYKPLVRAFCDILSEERLAIYELDKRRFEPVINVLVTREDQNGLPRFVVKQTVDGQRVTVAAAGLNWQSDRFAEIAVRTRSAFRRRGFGRSVVAALAQHLIKRGRRPLYAVAENNTPSIDLAQRLGFVDTGHRELMLEATKVR